MFVPAVVDQVVVVEFNAQADFFRARDGSGSRPDQSYAAPVSSGIFQRQCIATAINRAT